MYSNYTEAMTWFRTICYALGMFLFAGAAITAAIKGIGDGGPAVGFTFISVLFGIGVALSTGASRAFRI